MCSGTISVVEGKARKDAPLGAPRILAIDHDLTILSLIARVLEVERMDVWCAEDGYQGIDLFQQDADVSLVILDWRLPGMNGEQVFDRLVAIRPQVKVIISSGESPAAVERAFCGRRVVRFLPKPFNVRTLVTAVKSALAA